MTTPPVGIERRVGQRFPYLLPLSLRQPGTSVEGVGFTQDLSSRGVFFFTNAPLTEGSEIELTLRMPSEITLGESMPVRCRGRILRVESARPHFRSGFLGNALRGNQDRSSRALRRLRVSPRVLGVFRHLPAGLGPAPPPRRRPAPGPLFRPFSPRLRRPTNALPPSRHRQFACFRSPVTCFSHKLTAKNLFNSPILAYNVW